MDKNAGKNVLIGLLILALFVCMAVIIVLLLHERKDVAQSSSDGQQSSSFSESESASASVSSGSKSIAKVYNISDYLVVRDAEVQGNTGYTVKLLELKNLPNEVIADFNARQNHFVNPGDQAVQENTYSNRVMYGIYDHILSIYIEETTYPKDGLYRDYEVYSINIDLEKQSLIGNSELLGIFGMESEALYQRVLGDLANNVTAEAFLQSTTGDVTAPQITIAVFSDMIPEYSLQLKNEYEAVTLYISGEQMYCSFDQAQILKLLGMGTNMGAGLKWEPQVIAVE